MLSALDYTLIAVAALAAGAINALAGGGTLVTFPVMTAVGIPPVVANVTNTVALCPGYLSGTLAQWRDLDGQWDRLKWLVPAGLIGGIGGGLLLIASGERVFGALIPYLILLAATLLALQEPVKKWLVARRARLGTQAHDARAAAIPIGIAALYGGYFGAGLGVILLATLGITLDDTLTRLNAVKQFLSLVINVAAAAYFALAAPVLWSAVMVMAAGALIGGALGGRLAGRIKASHLRAVVVGIGYVVGLYYLIR